MMIQTYTLSYDEVPPSLNRGGTGSRRHWSVGYKEKQKWEGVWAMLLMAANAHRGMAKVFAEAVIEVEDNKRRDVENYRSAITKPLADAMVKGGWLADDTAEFFEFGQLKIRSGMDLDLGMATDKRRTNGRTIVTVEARYDS